MPTVTGIHHFPRRSNRRQIELDNGESFDLDLSLVTRHGLSTDLELDDERLDAIRLEDERIRAKTSIFNILRARPFSRKELHDRLKRKGFSEEAAGHAVETAASLGYVSDKEYAKAHVASRMRSKPRGRLSLRQELRKKGIDRATIERTLTAISDDDEREAARQVAERQMARYRTLPQEVARRRMYSFLSRRGFSYEHVLGILRKLFDAEST